MRARLRALRDRQVLGRERHTAFAAVAVLLTTSAVLLTLTQPPGPRHLPPRRPLSAGASRPPAAMGQTPVPAVALAPMDVRAARAFLAGYLAYLYGRAGAPSVTHTTLAFARSLRAHPPLVPPAMRARDPRVLSLQSMPAPLGLVGVSALINDGEPVNYTIGLLITTRTGEPLVSAVQGAS
jgi:hypothetical protein